jgi:hypothetical protein
VHGELTFLSGEICLTRGPCFYGSRTEGQSERAGIAIEAKGAEVAMGAGLRPSAKALERPPDPTATRTARLAVTLGVMGQKSAEVIVAVPPWKGDAEKGRTGEDKAEPWTPRNRCRTRAGETRCGVVPGSQPCTTTQNGAQ